MGDGESCCKTEQSAHCHRKQTSNSPASQWHHSVSHWSHSSLQPSSAPLLSLAPSLPPSIFHPSPTNLRFVSQVLVEENASQHGQASFFKCLSHQLVPYRPLGFSLTRSSGHKSTPPCLVSFNFYPPLHRTAPHAVLSFPCTSAAHSFQPITAASIRLYEASFHYHNDNKWPFGSDSSDIMKRWWE